MSDRDSDVPDRDVELLAVLKEGIKNRRPPAAIAQRIGDLGYRRADAVHDRAVIGQAHAPIKGVLDKWDGKWPYSAQSVVDDLRAALDLAAVAERERAVQQRTLRDAGRVALAEGRDEVASWLMGYEARADALGGDDRG